MLQRVDREYENISILELDKSYPTPFTDAFLIG